MYIYSLVILAAFFTRFLASTFMRLVPVNILVSKRFFSEQGCQVQKNLKGQMATLFQS